MMTKKVPCWLVAGALALVTGCGAVDETGNPVRYITVNGVVVDGALSEVADATDAALPTDRLDVPPTGDVVHEAGSDVADSDTDVLDVTDSSDTPDAPSVDMVMVIDLPMTDMGVDVPVPVDMPMGVDVIDVPVVIDMPIAPDVQPDVPMGSDVIDVPAPIDTPVVPDVPCPMGQTRCSGTCVDTQTSTAHCNGCGNACPGLVNATAACNAGVCSLGACAANFANCDNVPANGCEVDTRTSVANCGACGTACPARANAFATCVASTCGNTCVSNFANCNGNNADGCEVDTRTNAANCGTCSNACPARANAFSTCVASTCGNTCVSGFANCDGVMTNGCEVDTRTNVANCGACGNTCATGVCAAGTCLSHPVLDVLCADSRVVGLWVRTGDSVSGNPVGNWVYQTCPTTSPPRLSRIDLRRLSTPHATPSMRVPVTTWVRTWGLEVMAMTSMTTPLCPLGASTCPSCGTGAGFSCLRVQCALTGREADGNFTYAQAYNNDLPPGVSGSGTLYLARLGFLSSEFRDMCPP